MVDWKYMTGEQQELWIESAVAEEINEWIHDNIFCANAKYATLFAMVIETCGNTFYLQFEFSC
jgi:hypothetical protein